MSRGRSKKKVVDSRQLQPIAHVVDSSGKPVLHTWKPSGRRRSRTTEIAIYWQETGLPDNVKGIHRVWLSDEEHGDEYPWKQGNRPHYLSRFMKEATDGFLSATFKLTDWGRQMADEHCKCRSGRQLKESSRPESKIDERCGMNAKQWKKHLRKLKTTGY